MKNRIKASIIAFCILTATAQVRAMEYLAPRPTFTEHCKNLITGAGQGAAMIASQLCGLKGYMLTFWAVLHGALSVRDVIWAATSLHNNEECNAWTTCLKYNASSVYTNAIGAIIYLQFSRALGKCGWPDAQQ